MVFIRLPLFTGRKIPNEKIFSANLIFDLTCIVANDNISTIVHGFAMYKSFLIQCLKYRKRHFNYNPFFFCCSFRSVIYVLFFAFSLHTSICILMLNTIISLPQTIYQTNTKKTNLTYRQIHFDYMLFSYVPFHDIFFQSSTTTLSISFMH